MHPCRRFPWRWPVWIGVYSVAAVYVCVALPKATGASSWNPTLIVNTEAFQTIDDSNTASNIQLKFGDTVRQTITYDRTNTRFNVSAPLFVSGDVTATGALRDALGWMQNQGDSTKLQQGYNNGGFGGGATPGNLVMSATGTAVMDTAHVNTNSKGFNGAVFDGRYLYLAPNTNGQVTRYDTLQPLRNSGAYAVFDSTHTNANSTGFKGAAFDGRYLYLIPAATSNGQLTRYDTTQSFRGSGSWTVFDTTAVSPTSKGFNGAAFDGRYLYLVPGNNGSAFGQVTRFDTTKAFGATASYDVFDSSHVNANSVGFKGAAFDGQYLYLVPNTNGQITRYDTTQPFRSSGSWIVFDATHINANSTGFNGAVFDGRYVYLIPAGTSNGQITRYDTSQQFRSSGAYLVMDTATVNSNSKGFAGGTFDGRYLYLAPNNNGSAFGQVTRYDTTLPFTSPSAYSFLDTTTANANSKGFNGASFDGRYVYLIPFNNGSAFGQITRITAWAGGVDSTLGIERLARSPDFFMGANTGGTITGVGIGTTSIKAKLNVAGTISGSTLHVSNDMSGSGSLYLEQALSGATIAGFGLVDCSGASTSKLLWNAGAKKFSCGSDSTGTSSFGTGNTLTVGDTRYVRKAGDTMTGTLTLNNKTGNVNLSLSASGTLRTESGFALNFKNAASDAVLTFGNVSAAQTLKFLNSTQFFRFSTSLSVAGTMSGMTLQVTGTGAKPLLFTDTTKGALGLGTSTPTKMLTLSGGGILQTAGGPPVTMSGIELTASGFSVYVAGNYAYVGEKFTSGNDLRIIDVTNPSAPAFIGGYDFAGTGAGIVKSVFASTRNVFVGLTAGSSQSNSGFVILDATNVNAVKQIGRLNFGSNVNSVYVSGKYAYVGLDSVNGKDFRVIDISNTNNPVEVGGIDLTATVKSVYVLNRYAYLGLTANGGTEFRVIDLSNPAAPVSIGGVETAIDVQSVFVSGRYAYIGLAVTSNEFRIVDVSNPAVPSTTGLGQFDTGNGINVITVTGKYARVGVTNNNGDEYVTLDVSNPAIVKKVGGTSFGASINSIFVAGKYAYVASAGMTPGLEFQIYELDGIDAAAASIGTIAAANLNVSDNARVDNNFYVKNALNVGRGGIMSKGPLSLMSNGTGTLTALDVRSVSGTSILQAKDNGMVSVTGTISGAQLRARNMTISGAVVYTSGSTLVSTAKAQSGQILVGRGTASPVFRDPTGSLVWYLDGTLAVGTSQGAIVTMPFGITANSVTLRIKGAPTGAALIVDIRNNGTTIFSTRPQINASATTGGGNASFSVTNIPSGNELSVNVDQVGSTFSGSGLTVMLNGTRKY